MNEERKRMRKREVMDQNITLGSHEMLSELLERCKESFIII
jgi:hypothetical protein